MIFKEFLDKKIKGGNIAYLFDYVPAYTGKIDKRSRSFLTEYKSMVEWNESIQKREYKPNPELIARIGDMIYPYLDDDFAIATIPSSKPSSFNGIDSAQEYLVEDLCSKAKGERNIIPVPKALFRTQKKDSAHLGGDRSNPMEGVVVIEEELDKIIDKDILLIDDIVTTGTSITEATRLLRSVGAAKNKSIIGFSFGKTVSRNDQPGYIFVLEDSLFMAEQLKIFDKNMKTFGRSVAKRFLDSCFIQEKVKVVLEQLKKEKVDFRRDIIVLSWYPREIAEMFLERINELGFPITKLVVKDDFFIEGKNDDEIAIENLEEIEIPEDVEKETFKQPSYYDIWDAKYVTENEKEVHPFIDWVKKYIKQNKSTEIKEKEHKKIKKASGRFRKIDTDFYVLPLALSMLNRYEQLVTVFASLSCWDKKVVYRSGVIFVDVGHNETKEKGISFSLFDGELFLNAEYKEIKKMQKDFLGSLRHPSSFWSPHYVKLPCFFGPYDDIIDLESSQWKEQKYKED